MFDPVTWETDQLKQWQEEDTFALSVEAGRKEDGSTKYFVFQEGPPTANGEPGLHHVLARTFKDLVCRWKTMQGFVVERKAGWDCHGLPVEREVEKKLGLSNFKEVESFGLERFNQLCQQSVWTYAKEWERLTERMGYWTDLNNRYATLDLQYMEAEWWALKELWQKGYLKKGYKVLPYSPKTGCTYSNRDVAEGYKEVTDLTCFVKFPLVSAPIKVKDQVSRATRVSMLVWTSTPWSLPGNLLLAVNRNLTYALVEVTKATGGSSFETSMSYLEAGELLCVAETLLSELEHKLHVLSGATPSWKVVARLLGSELLGQRYAPPFQSDSVWNADTQLWQVVHGEFVNSTDGTGVVHVAPMYGEDDRRLCNDLDLDLSLPPCQHVVGEDGCFLSRPQAPHLLWGLDVTSSLTQEKVLELLYQNGSLCRAEPLTRNYPHCWRNKSHRLLYYAMDSWFVTMADPTVRSLMQQLNSKHVQFAPERVKEGRFGEWLSESRDWCVSRKRTWGCPLPVWVCRKEKGGCGMVHCVGSRKELQSLLVDDSVTLDDLHTTKVDSLVLHCRACNVDAAMTREPYVLDCWFDSGCAPFAQHYGEDNLNHPVVDFVAEGQDQCRGWFYSLLALSTTLFDRPAYKKCLVLGLVLDKHGKKMSKSLGNVVDPWHHFNDEGADAVRWYLLRMCAPWADRRFDAQEVRSANQKFFCVLFDVAKWWHSQWDALESCESKCHDDARDSSSCSPGLGVMDQWVLSRLARLVEACNKSFERDLFHVAVSALEEFVNEDLSKTYVRLSRSHFSDDESPSVLGLVKRASPPKDQAKFHCLQTTRTVLLYVCRLVAPMAPFFVDTLHRSLLATLAGSSSPKHSVHLAPWPTPHDEAVANWLNPTVEEHMGWLLGVMEAGRVLHNKSKRPGRLPLSRVTVSLPPSMLPVQADTPSYESATACAPVSDEPALFLAYELNARTVELRGQGEFQKLLQQLQVQRLRPNFSRLGSRFNREMADVLEALELEFGPLHNNKQQTSLLLMDLHEAASATSKNDGGNDEQCTGKKSKKQAKKEKKARAKKMNRSNGDDFGGGWEGPKVDKALKALQADGGVLEVASSSTPNKTYRLSLQDFFVSQRPRDGNGLDSFAVSSEAGLVLDGSTNTDLVSLYLTKELVHFVHQMRKKLDKERLLKGRKDPLDRVNLRLVVFQDDDGFSSDQAPPEEQQLDPEQAAGPLVASRRRDSNPLLSERDWTRVVKATRAVAEKSSLVQNPDATDKMMQSCEKDVELGLMVKTRVRGYGSCCPGFHVFGRCDEEQGCR